MSTRKERTRQAVLDAAWRLLSEEGAAAVRLEDVASAAGVSRQSIYLHFGSRSALFIAVVDYVDEVLGLQDLLAEVEHAPSPVEALSAMMRLTARYAEKIHAPATALSRARHTDADAEAAYESRMKLRRGRLRKILVRLKSQDLLRPGWSVPQLTDVLWAAGTPENYEALVVRQNWSVAAFERWLLHVAASFLRSRS